MGDHVNIAGLIWGLVLTVAGAWLFGVGVGWWDLALIDLRYVLPATVILVGTGMLLNSVTTDRG